MKEQDFEKLKASVEQAIQIKRGQLDPGRVFEMAPANIRAIREKLGKSQSEFALMIGVSLSTLQNWEQGRRRPDGPARALLKVASAHPDMVDVHVSAIEGLVMGMAVDFIWSKF